MVGCLVGLLLGRSENPKSLVVGHIDNYMIDILYRDWNYAFNFVKVAVI